MSANTLAGFPGGKPTSGAKVCESEPTDYRLSPAGTDFEMVALVPFV